MAEPSFNFYNYIGRILSDRVVIQMEDEIYLDRADVNPLLSFATLTGANRTVENMDYAWLEDKIRPDSLELHAQASAPSPETNDWTFTVDEKMGTWVADENTVFFAPNGTQFKVKSVTAGSPHDTITATKWPSTQDACGNVASGAKIILSYPVVGDLADVGKGNFHEASKATNQCEQFLRSVSMSRVLSQTRLYGGDLRKREHQKQLMAFRLDQEAALLYGIGCKDVTGVGDDSLGGTVWRTNGIRNSGLTGIDYGTSAALDYPGLLSILGTVTEYYNLSEMTCMTPTSLLNALQTWAFEKVHTAPGDTSFGTAITKLDTTYGPLNLVRARILDKFASDTVYTQNEVYFLPLRNYRKVTFGGLDGMEGAPKLYMNAQLSTQPNKILDFYNGFSGLEFVNAYQGYKLYDFKLA